MNANTPAALMNVAGSTPYVDKKRYGWMLGPFIPFLGVATVGAYIAAPEKMRGLMGLPALIVHGVVPLLDKLLGDDPNNPPDTEFKKLENDPYYERVLDAFVPMQLLATVMAAYAFSRKGTPLRDQLLGGWAFGYVNGIAVAISHEYSHKHTKYHHIMSHLALMPIAYNHFRVEHVYGHHKRVATPEDPASSRMGETFYQFWPRTVAGGIKSAIEIQQVRMARRGKGFFSSSNELLWGWAGTALFHAAIIGTFGRRVLPFWLTQMFIGFSLFELINYVEHYGLLRQKLPNGQYSRTMPEHSWNSNSIVGNLFLYQLQRHSDHHAYPTRVYQCLRNFPEAPTYPKGVGYAGMLIPALVPSLWRKIMDQRVFDHYKGDLGKANILPSSRDAIYKKFNYQPSTSLPATQPVAEKV